VVIVTQAPLTHPICRYHQAGTEIYAASIRQLLLDGKRTLLVDYRHLVEYKDELAREITRDYARYEPFLLRALSAAANNVNLKSANPRELTGVEFALGFYGLPQLNT
jgi:DNA replicative helicase MCM subunit Mcm2 (Cdc46/Mcm family)